MRGKRLSHQNKQLKELLMKCDLGSSVAESDNLLQVARIENSAFADLVSDRVDLVPGTKGSGKSALFRIFVDFLPDYLLKQKKVVIAHGVQAPGDPVFHAFNEQFSKLSETEFVSFWCIYLVSLAHEQFVKGPRYVEMLRNASAEVGAFRRACENAKIPEIRSAKTLRSILEWSLHVLKAWRPKLKYRLPEGGGEVELDLFGHPTPDPPPPREPDQEDALPKYVTEIRDALEAVLTKSGVSLWLMVDRLDEVFPRRSETERKALRGLLRAMRYFASEQIRVKVFLRDDMLDQLVRGAEGFTALTHVTVRQADTLRWTTDQIMAMLVKRLFANDDLANYLKVNQQRINASAKYRAECFNKVFAPTVFRGPKQSPTIRWIFNRCTDGRGAVTPRDVLDLIIRAKQRQQDLCASDPEGTTDWIISPNAIQYGFEELSERKRQTYLQAEFPHLWEYIEKFVGGKTDYHEAALRELLGGNWKILAEDLVAIGFLSKRTKAGEDVYSIPVLYKHGLHITLGQA
jgi:hypothetical protein